MATTPQHLLVIRFSAMGDCALAVPVLLRFKKTYPNVKLTIVTKTAFVPIFETIPGVDVIGANTKREHKGVPGLLKLTQQLIPLGIDGVADIHNVLRSMILQFFFSFYGFKFAKIDKGRQEKRALVRAKDKIFKPLKTTPERYAEVFEELGFPLNLSETASLETPEIPSKLLAQLGQSSQKWIGIAPFAAHACKTYPVDLMEQVIADLDKTQDYQILLFGGGKQETDLINNLASKYQNTVRIAGKFSFREEIRIIAHLDVMLSMDSGNGHLAAIYGVPVITLWGQTHPHTGFAPFQQPGTNQFIPSREQYPLIPTSVFGKKQLEGYEEAMRTIAPGDVVKRIKTIVE